MTCSCSEPDDQILLLVTQRFTPRCRQSELSHPRTRTLTHLVTLRCVFAADSSPAEFEPHGVPQQQRRQQRQQRQQRQR
jgi:hypothetical protein